MTFSMHANFFRIHFIRIDDFYPFIIDTLHTSIDSEKKSNGEIYIYIYSSLFYYKTAPTLLLLFFSSIDLFFSVTITKNWQLACTSQPRSFIAHEEIKILRKKTFFSLYWIHKTSSSCQRKVKSNWISSSSFFLLLSLQQVRIFQIR